MDYNTIGITCDRCNGTKVDPEHKVYNIESRAIYAYEDGPCQKCGGIGEMPVDIMEEE